MDLYLSLMTGGTLVSLTSDQAVVVFLVSALESDVVRGLGGR